MSVQEIFDTTYDNTQSESKCATSCFDYIVSNPPYQMLTTQNDNFNSSTISLFDKFHVQSVPLSDNIIMIYPAGRWWYDKRSLLRGEACGSRRLMQLEYFDVKESMSIFPNVGITDGLCIIKTAAPVRKYYLLKHNEVEEFSSNWGDVSIPPITAEDTRIADKLATKIRELGLGTLNQTTRFMQNQAKLTGGQLRELQLEKYIEGETKLGDNEIKLYANASGSIAGVSDYYVLDKSLAKKYEGEYQVCFGQSIIENPARKWRTFWFDNMTTYGNTAVQLYTSDCEESSRNFYKYASSIFFEYCIRINIAGRKKMLGNLTPDFKDYMRTDLVDWSGDIDTQLFTLFGFTDSEIDYIVNKY